MMSSSMMLKEHFIQVKVTNCSANMEETLNQAFKSFIILKINLLQFKSQNHRISEIL